MVTEYNYKLLTECQGCARCEHYPYFHYGKTNGDGIRLRYTKFDDNNCEVLNITHGIKHKYNGDKWELVVSKEI